MSQLTINLIAVDALIEQHAVSGSPETLRLLQTLREFYKADSDLEEISTIPANRLLEALSVSETQLSSLKSALNDELKTLAQKEKNPHSIFIGENNTFVQETETASSAPAPKPEAGSNEPARTFKASELTFNLPKKLQEEFQSQVDRLKEREEAANEKVRKLLEKEKSLEEEKLRLEKESSDFRNQLQEQHEALRKGFEEESQVSRQEVTNMRGELASAQKELEEMRIDRSQSLTDYDEQKTRLTGELKKHEELFKQKFEEMTDLMVNLRDQEKELVTRKETGQKRTLAKEKKLKKISAEQTKRQSELEAQTKAFNAEMRKKKTAMKKELQDKLQEMQQDFARKSDYHIRWQEEAEEEEMQMKNERESLRLKKQNLMLETKEKADERFKEKQAELKNQEKAFEEKMESLNEQEKEIIDEMDYILEDLVTIKKQTKGGEKLALGEIQKINIDQEKVLKRRRKFLKSLETIQKDQEAEFQKKLKKMEQEKETALAKVDKELKALFEEKQKLRQKEKKLVERETKELERLNQENEVLRNTMEVDMIERESALDEKEGELLEEREELADRKLEILKEERISAKKVQELEAEAHQQVQEIMEIKESVTKYQEDIMEFLKDIKGNYQKILDVQSEEYKFFKQKISAMGDEAQKITNVLKEKEKAVLEQTSATELASKERLKEHENLIEMMEKDLSSKVKEYNDYVQELAEVKKTMQDADEERQEELRESLVQYEDKLSLLGKAFENLSESFQKEKEKGTIEIAPEEHERKAPKYHGAVEYREAPESPEDLAKAEWSLAVRTRLGLTSDRDRDVNIEFLYTLAEKWEDRVRIPEGKFWMGHKKSKDAAPYKEVVIKKPVLMSKYPVTSIEFFRFVNETNHKTDAETSINGIAYHKGETLRRDSSSQLIQSSFQNPSLQPEEKASWLRPNGENDSLYTKYHHPVTQVTWNDAHAYCKWKSKELGKKVRLPSEIEWEYVASNFGQTPPDKFFWSPEEIIHFCNIEDTGILDTTAVDNFPEHTQTGGVADMYGNVFEWIEDSHQQKRRGKTSPLDYKIARGGSFITLYKHIAHWRRLSFLKIYCTSFLGFRTVCEPD